MSSSNASSSFVVTERLKGKLGQPVCSGLKLAYPGYDITQLPHGISVVGLARRVQAVYDDKANTRTIDGKTMPWYDVFRGIFEENGICCVASNCRQVLEQVIASLIEQGEIGFAEPVAKPVQRALAAAA